MILAVKWVDSTNYSYGWTRYSTTDVSIREITTCGILIDEDDDKIVLSHSKSTVPNDIYYDLFTIPKGCIIERKVIWDEDVSEKQNKGK